MIRPGGEPLTKKAIEKANIPEGARVLDVGCGEGDTTALLAGAYGFDATGVDLSYKLIDKAKTRHPGIDVRRMEAEFLDFESKTFDAVFMECSLSVFRLQEDALFEAYCLLKPGGKLIITDIYRKDPDPAAVAKMLKEAAEKAARPKIEGACGENEKPSFIMLEGALVIDELIALCEEIGFEIEHIEDVDGALAGFAAQAIMGHGSLEEYFKAVVPEGDDPAAFCACAAFCPPAPQDATDTESKKRDLAKTLGYFLMILKKQA